MFALKPFSRIQVNMSKNFFGIALLARKAGIGATQGFQSRLAPGDGLEGPDDIADAQFVPASVTTRPA